MQIQMRLEIRIYTNGVPIQVEMAFVSPIMDNEQRLNANLIITVFFQTISDVGRYMGDIPTFPSLGPSPKSPIHVYTNVRPIVSSATPA
jgi:hypothetical protein